MYLSSSFCLRFCIWNLWQWSVLLYWRSNKGHWLWSPVSLLWRCQQQWAVWAAYQPHRSDGLTYIQDSEEEWVWLLLTTSFFFSGLFKVVPEEMPYSTVEEMVSLRPVGLESGLPFTFTSDSKMTFGNFTLGARRALTVLSFERREGEENQVRCRVEGQQEASAEVCIPLSSRGEFYECESEECFTLRQIMSSPCLRSRRFRLINTSKSEQILVLSPVYQVHAIMNCENLLILIFFNLKIKIKIVCENRTYNFV